MSATGRIFFAWSTGLLLATACLAQPAPRAVLDSAPRAVLDRYCVVCHNQKAKTAGLMLDTLDLAHVGDHAEVWEKVVRKIRTGTMPPAGLPRPDKAVADSTAGWLEGELDRAALDHPNPGRPTLHRLNRAEYHNAIRDLLALDIDAAAILPGDNAGYGFDNNADALISSAALTERYLEAAAKISGMALGRIKSAPPPDTLLIPTDRDAFRRFSDDLPWGSRGGAAFHYYFPVDGEYEFQLRLRQIGVAGDILGVTDEPFEVDVAFDKNRVWTATVGGPEFMKIHAGELRDKKVLETLHFKVPGKAGDHLVQAYFVSKTQAFVEDLFDPYMRREPYRGVGPPELQSITIAPPASGSEAEAETPSRRRLLICHPSAPAEEAPCAEKILATFARRAYRRPVTAADLKMPLTLYKEGTKNGGFENGIELAVRGILVSPNFLFRFEGQPETVAINTPYRVSDLELASRLSFFLWSSIPDDELIQAAAKNTLHDPAVLDQQIKRMLADARSEALVQNFAGQWLHIRNVPTFHPSPELLFHFDDNLRLAMERETEMFFESIVRENRSVSDLINADYTFLNERLARHYGVPDVYGERFRRVSLPADSVRRGLLGQGSILTDTSRPNRTSPVLRGKWILENIFGAPPPAPPPNVPDLPEEKDPRKVLPMREQMAQHRANPVCAGCHAQMDQLGFALENFDAIGEWRTTYSSGAPVDAAAKLPDGTTLNGPAELRKVLLKHSDEFYTTVTEKLLTYALGRGLDASDAPAVRQIKRDAGADNYRFDALLQSIVRSVPFQLRMAQKESNLSN